jgi:hypothetical protein
MLLTTALLTSKFKILLNWECRNKADW